MPQIPPRLCSCGHRCGVGVRCPCQQKRDAERKARFDKTRPNSSQRGYTGAWEKARKAFLRRKPRCARCGAQATVVDHIKPHKGDQTLFWDQANWQPLCTPCHSGAKQREERRLSER
ncbi:MULTISPECIES: HNH endonuclease signature motif containing protein [Alphaproteobacteria]|uniref:HNH endonuclease signature motif containing protein n=1 Tax=Alphaproteobacteria TaxID=28211 RepID=UPI0032EF8838